MEISVEELRALEVKQTQLVPTGPLSTPPPKGSELEDLEDKMEPLLKDAISCIQLCLSDLKTTPDKTRVETAKWVIEDRRAYRKGLRPQSVDGDPEEQDPLTQAISSLRLVGSPE
jgi:hypothetical protein